MKRLLALALLATACLRADQGPNGWTLQTLFPGRLSVSTRPASTLSYMGVAECEYQKDQYRMVRSTYPKLIPESDRLKVYNAARDRYFAKDDKVLIDELECRVAGLQAHRIVFSYRKGSRVVDLRIMISGRDVYEMSYEHGIKEKVAPEADLFFTKAALILSGNAAPAPAAANADASRGPSSGTTAANPSAAKPAQP